MKDQIEILTHDKNSGESTPSRKDQQTLQELPAEEQQERNALLDFVRDEEKDEADPEHQAFEYLETICIWMGCAAAIAIVVALTHSVLSVSIHH